MARETSGAARREASSFPAALLPRVGFLLAQAHMAMREKADEALDGVGLTMKGFATMATLVSDGPTSQQRLSRRIRMDPATMVDVIDSLEDSGYLKRRRNPADRREYALELTPAGRSLYARAERAILESERQTASALKPDELRTLSRLLLKIADVPR